MQKPQPATAKPKLGHVGEGGSAASGGSSAGGAAGSTLRPQAQGPSLWREQLIDTDWGQVRGLVDELPRVPMAGVHSPDNQKVLRAFQVTPLADVKAVLVAKVRLLPCVRLARSNYRPFER